MTPLTYLKQITLPVLYTAIFFCFGFLPQGQSAPQVAPAPDGCYPNYTTAEGCKALNLLTTGAGNSGLGWYALYGDSTGNFNTGVGGGALALNNADSNTAVGAAALLLNTTGTQNTAVGTDALVHNGTGNYNTAVGAFALFSNTEGSVNTANGDGALFSNTAGSFNTANGNGALYSNTTGSVNTANGNGALYNNTIASENTANGYGALYSNTTGDSNTANGDGALYHNTTGIGNTANGYAALNDNTDGVGNTAIGYQAGYNLTGSGNVCIGASMFGMAGETNTTRIRNVYSSVASARAVYVDSDDKIGTLSSSRRYKQEIKPMEQASETLFALKPVTFRYKKEVDRSQTLSFGLIAEEVAEVNPKLITCDEQGQPQTVRYEAVNAMLLNEFLKEHRKVEAQERKIQEQENSIARLKSQFEVLNAVQQKEMQLLKEQLKQQAAQIQQVGAKLETRDSIPASEVVMNRP